MLNASQTRCFNEAYDSYRSILQYLMNNGTTIVQDEDSSPALIMIADLEIQRFLLDISSCEIYSPTESEQVFIKSLIESGTLLKSTIPGYAKFYRNMNPENYQKIEKTLCEKTKDIPIALQTAIAISKKENIDPSMIIDSYKKIFNSFVAMSNIRESEKKARVLKWISLFKNAALEQGITLPQDTQIKPESVDVYLQELYELVGLDAVKSDVNELVNILRVNELRNKEGLPSIAITKHMVFTGNPGTGKTTVARILAAIYKQLGVLSKGHLIEVDRSGLVAGYVGQTESKTKAIIEEALGGVLFIDEAYALAKDGNDFGQNAIDTILKAMEDYRNDLIVIVAGYPDLMEKFIDSNPGLRSRFTRYISFPDYTPDEMQQIFIKMIQKDGYQLGNDAEEKLLSLWEQTTSMDSFGNGRGVRNIYESVLAKQSSRIIKISSPSKSDLLTIRVEDIPDGIPNQKKNKTIGFLG